MPHLRVIQSEVERRSLLLDGRMEK